MPPAASGSARFNGVWPPKATIAGIGEGVASPAAAKRSASSRLRTLSASNGSKYRRVEESKSVETVSGFEFTMTADQPASRSAAAAFTAQ